MSLGERDPFTGHMTTGHEWNGIKELNAPVPRPVWLLLAVLGLFAVVWTVLMPSWPGVNTYFRGLLGADQHRDVGEALEAARLARAGWAEAILAGDYEALLADEAAMAVVRPAARTLFGDNCAGCHGGAATGSRGYPDLVRATTLWGSDAAALAETIRVGINAGHAETRFSQMPALGRTGMMSAEQVALVTDYVLNLAQTASTAPDLYAEGAQIFADRCAGCHGVAGTGNPRMGAPDLTDASWIYGADRESVRLSIHAGRQGHMPAWEGRLSALERKMLTLYVLDLRAGAAP